MFFILLFLAVINVGCEKDIEEDEINNVNNAKLKQISTMYLVLYNEELSYKPYVTNPEKIWHVTSGYEYDNVGRISKISKMYNNGTNNEVIGYDIYTYNEKNQLEKVKS